MKNIILLIVLVFIQPAFAEAKSSSVISLLAIYCEKTWCNEVAIEFKTMQCDFEANKCVLDFNIAQKDELTCTFHNYKSFDQIIENDEELSERFLEEVTDCVTTKL